MKNLPKNFDMGITGHTREQNLRCLPVWQIGNYLPNKNVTFCHVVSGRTNKAKPKMFEKSNQYLCGPHLSNQTS